MEASLLLCDTAQVSEGKFYILGGGWRFTKPSNLCMAVAINILVDKENVGQKHRFELALQDESGQFVDIGSDDSPKEIKVSGEFEAKIPEGHPPEIPISVKLAVNLQIPSLEPGSGFSWVLLVDNNPEASVRFYTRA